MDDQFSNRIMSNNFLFAIMNEHYNKYNAILVFYILAHGLIPSASV